MAMNSEYRGTASNVAASKKKSATKTKTVATPGTKVSQATIDKIKAMGMTKALKGAANASPEMREGLKRLYGAKRVAAAGGSSARYSSPDAARAGASSKPSVVKYKSADAARSAASKPAKSPAKSADAARAAAMNKSNVRIPGKSGFGATNMPNKNTKPGNFGTGSVRKAGTNMPKRGTTDPFAKFVFGLGKKITGGANNGMTAAQVAAENKRRAAAVAKAKANKNK